ncbi:MAG: sensor histidine kinase, partial [Chloroflexota bacterium]
AEALKLSTYGGLNEKQNRAVDVIEKSGHRLLSLINDLLDYSRLQSGMFKLLVERYALSEICKATLTAVEPDFKQKNQKVSLQIDPQMIELHTDVVAAKKMLIHLLRNAIKFTPAGGEFGITVIGKKDEQMVEITVWDKGIGIKESDISEIFTPFVQLDAILARQYEGTGLGLAIVHRLVELFNGKIHVLSTPGEGSSFIICLPWQPPVE